MLCQGNFDFLMKTMKNDKMVTCEPASFLHQRVTKYLMALFSLL